MKVANGRQAVHEDLPYSHDVGKDGGDVLHGKAAVAIERGRRRGAEIVAAPFEGPDQRELRHAIGLDVNAGAGMAGENA